ncbi:hypothetical protein WJX73_007884 [Symbiochloris irregularis]|uniref:Uncharacterized protein n=1 Tax=Symbiochloris irregularis TaxID=706552 RepID=A0AAW1PC27_9CHLO
MSDTGAPPTLNLQELLTWHRENTWFSFHGKAVRSRVSERSHHQLRPVFDLLKESSTETISLAQLTDILKVSGQSITQQSFQQMLKGVTGSIQHGLSYPQFVQLVTRDHEVMVEPQDGHGSPRAVRLCHDNKEVLLRAYCRKQMLEGVMANENNWRVRAQGMQQGWASKDNTLVQVQRTRLRSSIARRETG